MDDTLYSMIAGAREGARALAVATDAVRSQVLLNLASLIEARTDSLLEANADDLGRTDPSSPLRDRLALTPARLAAIAADLRRVASLPCPAGREMERRTLPNGLLLRKVSVPFGVIGVIYEARPNVTFDVAALCFKSGNACVLKGGSDARSTNAEAATLIHRALAEAGLPDRCAVLLPPRREATEALLQARGLVDVCIPRGGRGLIDFVRDNARIPVIETGAGVVHTYIDSTAPLDMAAAIVDNAKTRRVSVCNALDTLLVHSSRLADLPALAAPLAAKGVRIHADPPSRAALAAHYPADLLVQATPADWDTEWMALEMGLRTVGSLGEAMAHIAAHGSGHSESIVTADDAAAAQFQQQVDAACVYVNAPTSFTDGGQFGLGAEIGISTQKLGPRGPMGLAEITAYRWLVNGSGQTRPAN